MPGLRLCFLVSLQYLGRMSRCSQKNTHLKTSLAPIQILDSPDAVRSDIQDRTVLPNCCLLVATARNPYWPKSVTWDVASSSSSSSWVAQKVYQPMDIEAPNTVTARRHAKVLQTNVAPVRHMARSKYGRMVYR